MGPPAATQCSVICADLSSAVDSRRKSLLSIWNGASLVEGLHVYFKWPRVASGCCFGHGRSGPSGPLVQSDAMMCLKQR